MKNKILTTFIFLLFAMLVYGQQSSDVNAEQGVSFNDKAVSFAEKENYWQSIQSFERALRTTGRQRRVAKRNLNKFKTDVDLPAHSVLHFGWLNGIGKLANGCFNNFWLLLSLMALIACIAFYFVSKRWTWKKIIPLLILAVFSFSLSLLRANYIEAEDLVIFKTDTELKDKPYDVSGEKQIVFEGQMARVEQRYEDFLLVQTDTYESGWVLESDVVGVW